MRYMKQEKAKSPALLGAIVAAGSMRKLARALGISTQAVSAWSRVPAARVLDVERITSVSRHLLRPDVFGPQG